MNNTKKEITEIFKKYCTKCKGLCCKQGDATFFSWEFNALSLNEKTNKKISFKYKLGENNKSDIIKRVNIKRLCPFSMGEKCGLKLSMKPIDCIVYPIYPNISYKYKNKEIINFFIHKSCPLYKEIAKDKEIISLISKFWYKNIESLDSAQLKKWFGDKRNYWLDKNIYKIK